MAKPLKAGDKGYLFSVAIQYVTKNPNSNNSALARLMYKETKPLFSSVEACRSAIRRVKGACGEVCRGEVERNYPELNKLKEQNKHTVNKIPKSLDHNDDWEPLRVSSERCLILSDIHIPFHDETALEMACAYGKQRNVDTIILNGDAMDIFKLSRWQKDPREREFPEELKIAKQFWHYLRNEFPNARIIYKIGNHEERFNAYMIDKAPELLGVDFFSFDQITGVRKYEFDVVDNKRPIILNGDP